MKPGLYVHFPFCRSSCAYCAFYSLPCGGEKGVPEQEFISSLKREAASRFGSRGPNCDTLYLGGGSPGLLSGHGIEEIMELARGVFGVDDEAEISIELNPEDVSPARLEFLASAGINRMVLGVQTLDAAAHSVIGRSTKLCTCEVLDMFFAAGGFSHCVDVIYGIPGQSMKELENVLNTLISYRPAHVSAYMLTLEHGTPLAGRIAADDAFEKHQAESFSVLCSQLHSAGYEQYEVSNFSLPGFYSRHNMKYWDFSPYIGLGPSAHSFFGGYRTHNPPDAGLYMGGAYMEPELDSRGEKSAMAEFLMTGLRLAAGISLERFTRVFGRGLPAESVQILERLEDEGLLEVAALTGNIRIPADKIILTDSIVFRLTEPLL